MFSNRSMKNFRADPFNLRNARNASNTSRFDYNCAGFALDTYSWYCPSHTEYAWGWLEEWSIEYMELLTKQCVQIMLYDFADLRIIEDVSQVRADEYAIAFRVSSDGDFHYMKQIRKALWRHKCGAGTIQMIHQNKVFTTDWCDGRYNGPLVLFAKKRG